MNAIALLSSATARDRDTYSNLSGMFASLILEVMMANKNLVEALKKPAWSMYSSSVSSVPAGQAAAEQMEGGGHPITKRGALLLVMRV